MLAWLLSNPTIAGFVLLILGALGWGVKQRLAGRKDERDRRSAERLQSIKNKKELDDEVAKLDPADRDRRFNRWMRDDR